MRELTQRDELELFALDYGPEVAEVAGVVTEELWRALAAMIGIDENAWSGHA
jgi:hypothetical protein